MHGMFATKISLFLVRRAMVLTMQTAEGSDEQAQLIMHGADHQTDAGQIVLL